MSWSYGYTTDVDYPHLGYNMGLSPAFQSFCLLNQNISAGLPVGGNYLELGFGRGVSLNVHAATTDACFWGTDFIPSHTCFAQAMASISQGNLQLIDASFEEFVERKDLPQFDAITLHGVWSWISHINRAAIVKLMRSHLKPGGVVFLSYNATPGWSPAIPVRHLMTLHAQEVGKGSSLKARIDSALAFTQQCAATHRGYFANNTEVTQFLKQISGMNRHYLAHDFFNADWHPMPFSDVATWLSEAKLVFGASANPLDHFPELNVPEEIQALLASIDSPLLRESVWDYLINQTLRRDIFVRGGYALTPLEALEKKRRQRFILLKSPSKVPLETRKSCLKVTLQARVYEPVLAALAQDKWCAKSLAWLEEHLADIPLSAHALWQALTILTGEGHVVPVPAENSSSHTMARCHALNTFFLQRARSSDDISVLASPVAGVGITVSRAEKLFLLGYREGMHTPEQLANFAWRFLRSDQSQGSVLQHENQSVRHLDENSAMLQTRAVTFLESRLAILTALGIE